MKKYSLLRAVALGLATLMTAASLFSCTPSGGKETKSELDKISLEHVYKVNYLDADLDENSWIQSAMSVGEDTFLIGSYYKETFVPYENAGDAAEGEAVSGGVAVTLPAGALARDVVVIETEPAIDSNGDGIADDDVAEDVPTDEPQKGTWEYENGIRLLKISPDGKVERLAQSPDSAGFNGELDEPGEPIIWNGKLVVSCFDCVTNDIVINTAHELPATLAEIELD